jgi:hypothetical protein
MHIARQMVADLEVLTNSKFGPQCWVVIEDALLRLEKAIDDWYHPATMSDDFSVPDDYDGPTPEDLT